MAAPHHTRLAQTGRWLPPESPYSGSDQGSGLRNPGAGKPLHPPQSAQNRGLHLQGQGDQAGGGIESVLKSRRETELRYATGPYTIPPFKNLPPSDARMVKLVDTRDLKSLGRKAVPVRFRLRAPFSLNSESPWQRSVLFDPGLLLWPDRELHRLCASAFPGRGPP